MNTNGKITQLMKKATAFSMALFLLISNIDSGSFDILVSAGTYQDPEPLESISDLGDWQHYNGLIFGDLTAYQADAEGAVAVQGAFEVKESGYDTGASYNYVDGTHIDHYKNEGNIYPTLLIGGNSITIGSSVSHLNALGGPIVMTEELHAYNATLNPRLTANGDNGKGYVYAEQSVLDEWFSEQFSTVTSLSNQYLTANTVEITTSEFTSASYIQDGAEKFLNTTLKRDGQVDERVLVVTVRTDADVEFIDLAGKDGPMKIATEWAIDYDLVIYNFPDIVNLTLSGSSQQYYGSTLVDPNWPEYLMTERQITEKHALAEKVIYNFPQAMNISSSELFFLGSVFAPHASFSGSGGSLNGQLISGGYSTQGGHELHAFTLSSKAVFDTGEEEEAEETGSIEIVKYASIYGQTTAAGLSGAEYILVRETKDGEEYYHGNGAFSGLREAALIYTTTDNGSVIIEDIPLGEYILREVTSPTGYTLNTGDSSNKNTYFERTVSITEDHQVLAVSWYNEPVDTEIELFKADSATKEGLEGAAFALIREADSIYDSEIIVQSRIESGSDGTFRITGLLPGTYRLTEISPPDGYEFLEYDSLRFEVLYEAGNFTIRWLDGAAIEGIGTSNAPFIIENVAGTPENHITIFKYDPALPMPDNGLMDAEFVLYRYDEENDSWILMSANDAPQDSEDYQEISIATDALGVYTIHSLLPGRYRLVETKSPDGYYLDPTPIEFTIDADTLTQLVEVPNTAIKTDLTIEKTGAYAGESAALAGAVFALERRDDPDGEWESVSAGITGADGQITFYDLAAGTYRLRETSAPAGYQGLDPEQEYITFTVSASHDNQSAIISDIQYHNEADGSTGQAGEEGVPVTLQSGGELGFILSVENQANTRDLIIQKIDNEIFHAGADDDPEKYYIITYLEGAEFRLQRRADGYTGAWQDYGSAFTSRIVYQTDQNGDYLFSETGEKIPATDDSGNILTEAVFEGGLIYGTYRVIETVFPEGYLPPETQPVTLEDATQGYEVHQFTITEAMAADGGASSYTVTNLIAIIKIAVSSLMHGTTT